MKKLALVFLVLLFATSFTIAQSSSPTIFYSNLTSGPNTGGQNSAGAFVTIYGKGFGSTQGSSFVTIGGGNAASYQAWSDTSITFQLGSAAKSGNITVNVGGVASSSVPFTVRAGNIYFVSTSGSNTRSGSYSRPWRTLVYAKNTMQAGDIVYVENGYTLTSIEANNSALNLTRAGTSSAPMAIVAYPKASVSVGSTTAVTTGINVTASNWVVSGLTLRGAHSAISLSNASAVRLTGSDLSCPNGYSTGACLATSGGSSLSILGNNIHDNGSSTATDLVGYAAVLLGSNNVELGWNQVGNTRACNAVDAHSTALQYSFKIHDNYIHDTRCSAISLGTVDPSQGAVSIYNNIIVNTGAGPAPSGTSATPTYAGIRVAGSSTAAQVYNNTIYNAGAFGGTSAGAVSAPGAVTLTNNILSLSGSEWYVTPDSNLGTISGPNNLFFGAGTPPSMFANSLASDPLFVSASTNNFHLQSGSPAIDAGATVSLATDYDGVLRPQGAGYDIGAYESTSQAAAAGTLVVTPSTLSFGTVTDGQTSSSSLTVTNSGSASVTISQINSNNAAFAISGTSFPLTLSAGQSAALTVTFAPSTAGAISGTLAVSSNASNAVNIAATGTGQAVSPTVTVSPSSLTFGSQVVGTTSVAQTVTLSNTSSTALSISGIAASGDYAQTNNCGTSLAANSSCSVSVTFTPTTSGTRTGAITFTDNASSSPQQVSLTGTATGATTPTITLSPTSLTFPSQYVGSTSAAQVITLTNTSTSSLSISSIGTSGDFSQTSNCGASLAAQASCQISVTFKPTATGTRTSAITFTDNAASSPQQVAVSGTGVMATLQTSTASLSFGTVNVGSTGSQSVVINNTGSASASISQISTGNAAFSVSGITLPATVPAGGSLTLTVTFSPAAAGSYTGTLGVTSNASNPTLSVALNGTGQAVTVSHSVSLTWSEASTVSGYNVYRSSTSGGGYSKINSSLNPNMAYTDSSVSAGQTYYYVLTAVDASGNESSYSAQVSATVPTP